jgi:hypothetical protein
MTKGGRGADEAVLNKEHKIQAEINKDLKENTPLIFGMG